MDIDKRLTEIDIFKLVKDNGIPFDNISDDEIYKCLEERIFLTPNAIYNASRDRFSYSNDKTFDLLKIATIVNEINNNTYNYNYPIIVWKDYKSDNDFTYDIDGEGYYHIRAFYFCQKNIFMSINISG